MITGLGIVFAVAYAACLIARPRMLPWVLAAALPFSHSAMIVVGDNGLSPFWFGAVLAAGRLSYICWHSTWRGAWRFLRSRVVWYGANIALAVFFVYSALITVIGPLVFSGLDVITPRGGLDSQVDDLSTLSFTISNLAQGLYLCLGITLVVYFLVEKSVSPRILEVAIVIGIALALFRAFFRDVWPTEFFDTIPSTHYATDAPGRRARGTFAEPSILGMFLAMSLAYLVSAFVRSTLRQRVYYGAFIVAALYLYLISYTGTALLALGVTAAVGAAVVTVTVVRAASRAQLLRFLAVVVGLAVVVALAWPLISPYTYDVVVQKLTTSSFTNRGKSNDTAFELFVDSYFLGIGLGSNRPSSLLFMLLSCVGIIGLLSFLRAMSGYLVAAWRDTQFRAVAWGLFAVIVAQFVAKPDLSMPPLWLLIALCAIAYRTQAERLASTPAAPALLPGVLSWPRATTRVPEPDTAASPVKGI